jgi:hypothetical protein
MTTVKTLDDLKPQTREEKLEADHYEGLGLRPIEQGSVREMGEPFPTLSANPPPEPTYESFLRDVTCSIDVVAVGRAGSGRVMLNTGATWLFTEYHLQVTDWVRPAAGAREIVANESGGVASVGGELTSAGRNLVHIGEQYLLFLEALPGTSAFVRHGPIMAVTTTGALDNRAGYIFPRAFVKVAPDYRRFLADLRTAARSCSTGSE